MTTEKDGAGGGKGTDPGSETTASTLELSREQEPLLKVEGLTKSYTGRLVVQGVSFSVEQGKIADLLRITGDPADPRTHVKAVWQSGESVYDISEERRLW